MKQIILFRFSVLISISIAIAFAGQAQVVSNPQTDHDLYTGLYQKGEYNKALIVLKRLTKEKASDGDVWYYLGLTDLQLRKEGDAVKALEKARTLLPRNTAVLTALAFAYLNNNDKHAERIAEEALEIEPKIAQAQYIVGASSLRRGLYDAAYERAKQAVEIEPKFADGYRLKAQALIARFAQLSITVNKPESRRDLLREAAGDMERFLNLTPSRPDTEFYKEYFEAIKFFGEYYASPENQKPIPDETVSSDPRVTPLKIISKPRAAYTDEARIHNVQGIVHLLIGFSEDGTIKHILILNALGAGLDQNVVAAAKQIRFEPKKIDGKPVSVAMMFQYGFNIY